MSLKTPLDKYREIARRFIAEAVATGKDWDSIASELSEITGEKITSAMVKYFYYREFGGGSGTGSGSVIVSDEDFDLEKELKWLYLVQKKRIAKQIRLEEEAGIPFPDTSKNIEIAAKVLEKIAKLSESGEEIDIVERIIRALEGDSGGGG